MVVRDPLVRLLARSSSSSRVATVTYGVDKEVYDPDSFHGWLVQRTTSRLKAGLGLPEYDLLSISENLRTIWER